MSYKLYTRNKEKARKTYTKEDLMEMSIYELKNLCVKHKIIKIYQNSYGKEKLVDIILKYRGNEERYLIQDYSETGMVRIHEFIEDGCINEISGTGKIRIPAKLTLYKNIGINKEDMYKIITDKDFEESNVLMLNGKNYLCGIFNLEKDMEAENTYSLSAESSNIRYEGIDHRNYNLFFFNKEDSEYLHKLYYSEKDIPFNKINGYKVSIVDFEMRELEETSSTLCIDFGTTNTTLGAYLDSNYVSNVSNNDILNGKIKLNSVNFVKFFDYGNRENSWIEMIPTVVYILDCSNPDNIKYLFGYDAKQRMKKNDYSTTASVFHSIKRWVNNYKDIIDIFDEEGNTLKIQKSEIIKEFMKYSINCAEHQFKCKFQNIHISSPVKLKVQFLEMFSKIMDEHNVEKEDVLDEGMSVLYNTIANLIEKDKFYEGEEYKALVIDCGGGTTDLSSCTFSIEEGPVSYFVNIKTSFENGDTNFGGDNITFRIMQFMKIVFSEYYKRLGRETSIDSLIDIPSTDIFRHVDEFGISSIYENFEERYMESENVIPTKFKEYENKPSDEYQKVKNNFYFLWEIADNMKKEFFQKTNILRNKFDSSDVDDSENDLNITQLNRWGLSVKESSTLESVNSFPNTVFNIKEINKLIKGDIYEIVRKFLDKFYENRELSDFSIIKLTGQSCRIDIFKEALKEFVPGKSIEFKQKKDNNSLELKLACLSGVIKYLNSKKRGDIVVNIENDIPAVPYSLSAFTFTGKEIILMNSMERINNIVGSIVKPSTTSEVQFYLKDEEDKVKKEYVYYNKSNNYNETTPKELEESYNGKIYQEDTDTINNGEVKFFTFTDENSWGFYVVPVQRENEVLKSCERIYFPFEDDLSELNFFDGMK